MSRSPRAEHSRNDTALASDRSSTCEPASSATDDIGGRSHGGGKSPFAFTAPRRSLGRALARRRRGKGIRSLAVVLGVATLLRVAGAWEWSLWEDEETTVYFALNPDRWFPRAFPVFFLALEQVYAVAGVSAFAGRLLATVFGLSAIAVTFVTARRFVSRECAVLASALLAINLGHVFWSQSIRYYTAAAFFQSLSLLWFLDGFERRRFGRILLANAALVAALLSHFSAILLVPVHAGYLMLAIARREKGGAYDFRGYGIYVASVLPILSWFIVELAAMEGRLSDWPIASARDPLHVLTTVGAYFGFPILALGCLGILLRGTGPRRVTLFFAVASIIPVLELAVIAQLDRVNVCWYYALFALEGFAILAALALLGLRERGHVRTAKTLAILAAVYYLGFLGLYFTVMHGDRPRWREAADVVKNLAPIDPESTENPQVFATVPGAVAHYLGIAPGETMNHPLVKNVPRVPPEQDPERDEWYVVKATHITPAWAEWYAARCDERGRFEAGIPGVRRTLVVYEYSRPRHAAPDATDRDPASGE